MLSCTVGQVRNLTPGDHLELKQSKNGRYRLVTVTSKVVDTVDNWLRQHPDKHNEYAPLFLSRQGTALTASSLNRLVKRWCSEANLIGNYGSHSLRKTWGYHQRKTFNQPTALLSVAFGHSSERQTMDYLCIQPTEIEHLYTGAL